MTITVLYINLKKSDIQKLKLLKLKKMIIKKQWFQEILKVYQTMII